VAAKKTTKPPTKAKDSTKPKRGRPEISLDINQAELFGYFRATYETMAEYMGCHIDTVRKAMQNEDSEFSKAYKKGFSGMKMKLSEAQVNTAINDHNPTLLVWLGKQYMGQKDNVQDSHDSQPEATDFEYTVI